MFVQALTQPTLSKKTKKNSHRAPPIKRKWKKEELEIFLFAGRQSLRPSCRVTSATMQQIKFRLSEVLNKTSFS